MNIIINDDLKNDNLDWGGELILQNKQYSNEYDELVCFNEIARDKINKILY